MRAKPKDHHARILAHEAPPPGPLAWRRPARDERQLDLSRASNVHSSQAQSGAATPVPTDGQPIASIPSCAPAPMRRPMSAPGRRERAAALTHPWWRSTGRAGASSLGWGSDRHQGRPPASRSAAASQQRPLARLLQPLGSLSEGSPRSAMKSGTCFGSTP